MNFSRWLSLDHLVIGRRQRALRDFRPAFTAARFLTLVGHGAAILPCPLAWPRGGNAARPTSGSLVMDRAIPVSCSRAARALLRVSAGAAECGARRRLLPPPSAGACRSRRRAWAAGSRPRAVCSNQAPISAGLRGCCPSSARRLRMRWIDSAMFSQLPPSGRVERHDAVLAQPAPPSRASCGRPGCPTPAAPAAAGSSLGQGEAAPPGPRCQASQAARFAAGRSARRRPAARPGSPPGPPSASRCRTALVQLVTGWTRTGRSRDGTGSGSWPCPRGRTRAAGAPGARPAASCRPDAARPGTARPRPRTRPPGRRRAEP